jgi:hypothetical protein
MGPPGPVGVRAPWRAEPLFGASCRSVRMVVQGARERMFCRVAATPCACSGSLACCPVDLFGRIERVAGSHAYAKSSEFIRDLEVASQGCDEDGLALERILARGEIAGYERKPAREAAAAEREHSPAFYVYRRGDRGS